jgi:ATP-dependent RNA helicase RhlE
LSDIEKLIEMKLPVEIVVGFEPDPNASTQPEKRQQRGSNKSRNNSNSKGSNNSGQRNNNSRRPKRSNDRRNSDRRN